MMYGMCCVIATSSGGTVRVHGRGVYTLHSGLPCPFNQPFILFNHCLVRLNGRLAWINRYRLVRLNV